MNYTDIIFTLLKTFFSKVLKSVIDKYYGSAIDGIVKKVKDFINKHKKVIVFGVIGVLSATTITSVIFGTYWIKRAKEIKESISTTIQNTTQPIIDNIFTKNKEINKAAETDISNIKHEIESSDVMNKVEVTSDMSELDYITIKIDGTEYNYALKENIDESKKQVKLISTQFNNMTTSYENQLKEKDKLIDSATSQLETLKQSLTTNISKVETNLDIADSVNHMFKFGIGGFCNGKISDFKNDFTVGATGNLLINKKYEINISTGCRVIESSPSIIVGGGLTYYF